MGSDQMLAILLYALFVVILLSMCFFGLKNR
jgi:hypothetical protein